MMRLAGLDTGLRASPCLERIPVSSPTHPVACPSTPQQWRQSPTFKLRIRHTMRTHCCLAIVALLSACNAAQVQTISTVIADGQLACAAGPTFIPTTVTQPIALLTAAT